MTHHEDPHHGAGHAEPNYIAIFVLLGVLTLVEVGVVFLPIAKLAIGVMLVTLAFTKAALVALYFMHLKFEKKTLTIIAATPIVLCVFLLFMLLPDSDPAKRLPRPSTAGSAHAAQAP